MRIFKTINIRNTLLLITFLTGVVSCIDDTFTDRGNVTNGPTVKVVFNFIIPDQKEIVTSASQTRAQYENYIGDVFLLVFDSKNQFLECHQAIRAQNATSYYASLSKQSEACQIYIVGNATSTVNTHKDSWTPQTTLAEIQSQLQKPSLVDAQVGAITEVPAMPPLVSVTPLLVPAIDKGVTFDEVILERATAKIVLNNDAVADLVIDGANLCKVPVSGYVFSGQNFPSITTSEYWGEEDGSYSLDYMIRRATSTNPLYCYEATAEHGTYLIMRATYKGVDGYYRINIVDGSQQPLALQRNHSYLVKIKKIQHPGYRTAREAQDNPALNEVVGNVDIEVKDPYSHDIVSNGEYYLGIENSEYILYTSDAVMGENNLGELVTMVYCNAASTASPGQASIKAYDVLNNPVTVGVEVTNPFPLSNDGHLHAGELRMKLPENVAYADIQLRIGNLERTIRVTRKMENISFGGTVTFDRDYVYGKISSPQSWIKFSHSQETDVDKGLDYIDNASGSLNVHLIMSPNLIQSPTSEAREALLYLSRANEKGRTKVKIYQPFFNIFDKEVTPIKNPYVGTFHRYNQTGERVIKMGGTSTGTWVAEVVMGRDFIKLVKGGSEDSQIYQMNPGNAESYQVYNHKDAKLSIAGSGEIIFRVGLKNTIAQDAHRYGVILVTHPGGTSRIFVRQGEAPDYLYRKDDPVLKGWTSHSGVPRPLTVKLSPYNLTDPKLGLGIQRGQFYADHNAMPLDYLPGSSSYQKFDKKKFTEYPTQAGYMFIWNTLSQPNTGDEFPINPPTFKDEWQWVRALHPVRPGSSSELLGRPAPEGVTFQYHSYDGSYSGNGDKKIPLYEFRAEKGDISSFNYTQVDRWYNQETDPCPYGYRYPHAGRVNTTPAGGDIEMFGQNAYYSELLQSMFYDPHISTNEQEMAKYTLWGYYADGFFDRRKIMVSPYGDDGNTSMVVKGDDINNMSITGNDIGYIGGLTFNPFNFASLFHPAVGYWSYGVRSAGSAYHYWTSDRTSTVISNSAIPLYLFATSSKFILIDSFGHSAFPKAVRCIRDPDITLQGAPGYE